MTDALTRFSNRVDNYIRYRPSYPESLLQILKTNCGLDENSVIADIGSGTGILSELFLRNGNRVIGVEPNSGMREAAESSLADYAKFESVASTAEETALENDSVDLITAGQAFHWFDRAEAKQEFARILKPAGWVVLIWNERQLDSTAFLRAYEDLLLKYGTDYQSVRHENVASEIGDFFTPNEFHLQTLQNSQRFDFEALKGRLLSSSYVPADDQPGFEPMLAELQEIFARHQHDGFVSFEYDTRVYYGQLTLSSEFSL